MVADANTKVNPPLRPPADTHALLSALLDGTFDLVATDHAPHAAPEKEGSSFADAAFGLSGLEFALPLMLSLVRAGHCTLSELIRWFTDRPAKLWGLPGGTLQVGKAADLVIFDPDESWTVEPTSLLTKNANTPLRGMELRGKVKWTLVAGEARYGG
jgi:dihydroorotase